MAFLNFNCIFYQFLSVHKELSPVLGLYRTIKGNKLIVVIELGYIIILFQSTFYNHNVSYLNVIDRTEIGTINAFATIYLDLIAISSAIGRNPVCDGMMARVIIINL